MLSSASTLGTRCCCGMLKTSILRQISQGQRAIASESSKSVVRNLLKERPMEEGEKRTVTTTGWIKSLRQFKNITFLGLDDGSSINVIQVALMEEALRNLPLTFGSAVSVEGVLVPSPGRKQTVEIVAHRVDIIRKSDPLEFPFKAKERHHVDYYRQYLHFRPRVQRFASLLRFRSAATLAIHQYFQENDFVMIHTPILTSNDCEGGGETFTVTSEQEAKQNIEFFKDPTVLTVSGQLHLEAAVSGLHRVYNFNPAFRAERQQSRRHLSEFWMVEAEVAFVDKLQPLLDLMEDMVKKVSAQVLDRCADDVEFHMQNIAPSAHRAKLDKMLSKPFIHVPYVEALKILLERAASFNTMPQDGQNLHKDHELFLVKYFGDVPVFVTHFPACVKPFYARQCEEDGAGG
ncbi:probable asparagine--tRNA ligase, mitochondrial isoform X2 [Paramacrobiotus metropolitanus]|uniref:probable asparagine--tRNA ligase, mitochondrial isoform X2 n=1 Tax=Paramacrobiotus metropolitanus TaxID=2943436 RepID=UPI0024461BE7|nr:probable asparagine--tRNA ligase, mitochondrial isoform X2 [Paramacrobiotus metropolitanus]